MVEGFSFNLLDFWAIGVVALIFILWGVLAAFKHVFRAWVVPTFCAIAVLANVGTYFLLGTDEDLVLVDDPEPTEDVQPSPPDETDDPIEFTVSTDINDNSFGTVSVNQSKASQGAWLLLRAVANEGYVFVEWYPANPAGFVVRDSMTFTAVFAEVAPVVPQIVSVTPNPAIVEQGGTVEIVVTTQGMPDGAWVDLNVAWRPGLSVVGGPRFYVADNQAIITVAAAENARLGRDGFAVAARTAGDWGSVVIIDSYAFVIEVI